MKFFRTLKSDILGGLTGSFLTLVGPVTPLGITGNLYTLEELAYQTSQESPRTGNGQWTFEWIDRKGFILQNKPSLSGKTPVHLRRAVYRFVSGIDSSTTSERKHYHETDRFFHR